MRQNGDALWNHLGGKGRPWAPVTVHAGDAQYGPLAHLGIRRGNPGQRRLRRRFGDARIPLGGRVDQQRAERLTQCLSQPVQFGGRRPQNRASQAGPHCPDQAPLTS